MSAWDFGFNLSLNERPSAAFIAKFKKFLSLHGLQFEGAPEVIAAVEDDAHNILAVASLEGKVIKMVATSDEWQEAGLSASVVSSLVQWARERGRHHLFIYTKPEAAEKFIFLGFKELARTEPHAALLEIGEPNAASFYKNLCNMRDDNNSKNIGSIVMNANPFTLGHKYLIEQACEECGRLYLIAVREDKSAIAFSDRFEIIKRNIKAMSCADKIILLDSQDYAVSSATFPSYFLKDPKFEDIARIQSELDARLFLKLFVPALGINVRFVGTEPTCAITAIYNEALKKILPPYGVRVQEIERLAVDGAAISASLARIALKTGDIDALSKYLPHATLDYLTGKQ